MAVFFISKQSNPLQQIKIKSFFNLFEHSFCKVKKKINLLIYTLSHFFFPAIVHKHLMRKGTDEMPFTWSKIKIYSQ